MTIEQVIEAREMPWGDYFQFFGFSDWLMMLIFFPALALFLTVLGLIPLCVLELFNDGRLNPTFEKVYLSIVFIASLAGVFASFTPSLMANYEPENWQEEIAVPFYESIPKTVHEIDIISIEGTQDPALFQVMFALKNEDGILVHDTVLSSIERKATAQTPTYEYRMVAEEIPNFKDEGKYEELIILPEDYPLMVAPTVAKESLQ